MSETDSITTLPAHIAHLSALNREAHDLMPFKVDTCSQPLGALRQKVWSCRTCGEGDEAVGVCYACSVSCHAEHDLVELFTRRSFTCDCPTTPHCTLIRTPQARATSNRYTRNFWGEFCRCERGKRYDPMEESESMVECLGCEDWFHESCLNLQDPQNPIPADTASQSSTSTIESPILPSPSYAHLLCASCVTSYPLLKRYAGTEGWCMIVPSSDVREGAEWAERWEVIGRMEVKVGEKRGHTPEGDVKPTKRARLSPSALESDTRADLSSTDQQIDVSANDSSKTCTAPAPNPSAQEILASLNDPESDPLAPRARGDVFLLPGRREAICTCPACITQVESLPFPLEDEPEYEPLEDSPEPSEELLAQRALEGLPRAQTIEALMAFNSMKDKLKAFLEPFRDGGRVVSAEDIGEFMQSVKGAGK